MNPESILKGRMAETLFEELMRRSGNAVYRFGYEAIVQNLAQLQESFDKYSEVGERIRAIPDFIVVNRKGKPAFAEVKFRYRTDMALYEDSVAILKRVTKFWGAKVIFVNCWKQPYFEISEPPYLDKNKKLVSRPLLSETDWNIDRDVYDHCEELVHKYLTPTLIPGKK